MRNIKYIYYHSKFLKKFRKLPIMIQNIAQKKEQIFKNNPFDPQLQTHKLKGELQGYWSYSINYEYRILFEFLNDENAVYYDIGTHEIYK